MGMVARVARTTRPTFASWLKVGQVVLAIAAVNQILVCAA